MRKLLVFSIKTPDGTILTSRYQYDYVEHKDKNGEVYSIDGGPLHPHGSANEEQPTNLFITIEDNIEVIREKWAWGTYGKSGKEPLTFKLLKNMENDHILSVIENVTELSEPIKMVFIRELWYREGTSRFTDTNHVVDGLLKHINIIEGNKAVELKIDDKKPKGWFTKIGVILNDIYSTKIKRNNK